ncbi:retrovirus-related pol polyprotein from transposon TNT 1-94 [Tanacetum coccineum]|uniref:Retrovirus-related pol polyprotein from transposon TNT 1-94 n=1 Tax=Tanacetum coccineum TaxID=301880 RepID=A0ABQ5FHY3_9ASTR
MNTNPRMSTSTKVNHRTNVSRPRLRSTQMKDKVVPNTSQVKFKKTKVEEHHRISSNSNQTKSVTAFNDSLKSRTSIVNVVCATCGKCVFNSNHDACVYKYLNDVNSRTKKPKLVPISTRKPKSQGNKYVATYHKKTVASETTVQNSKSYYRMLYEKTSKAWKCYGDLVQGNITINMVYYVKGLNHNVLFVGQFCDADLEVAFRKSTFFVRDLQGNDLLTGNHGSDLYTISFQETTSSTPICLMAKASPTQAWLWHRRLSHLNFDYINFLSKKDIMIGLPKLKPNGDALRKCILEGLYTPFTVIIPAVHATDNSLAVPERTTVETVLNIDEIYSTVDACKTVHEMWEVIKRLQQEWSRFVTIVKQQHKLDEVSYHKLFDILKQYQKEVNELRAESIAKNANPLALVAAAQPYQDLYYQTSKSHKSYVPTSKTSLPTRSHATIRHKGKEIAKPITPPSESASKEDSDSEQAQKDKEMQKILALIAKYFKKIYKLTNKNLRTSSNTKNKNVDTTPRYKNNNQTGQFGNQRTMTIARARETVANTNEEIDEQELEAHYSYMAKIQEVPTADSGTDSEPLEHVQYDTGYNVFANEIQHSKQSESISNTCVVEMGDSIVIPDSPDMCDNDIQDDQNDVECDNERAALANLIANLKLDVDENKKIQKQLKKANATLTQELTECKSILAETSRTLGESNSIRDSCLVALQNKQTEFERYKAFNDRTLTKTNLNVKLNEDLKDF